MEQEEYILVWESPKIQLPEFRLYYDDKGNVICYTCEKLEGNYIVIDARTYAEGRPDLKVVDGRISTKASNLVVSKLKPDTEGVDCSLEDVSILVSKKDKVKKQKWNLKTYELR